MGRTKIKKLNPGQKYSFSATVGRAGNTIDGTKTILLQNIKLTDKNIEVTDHVWIPVIRRLTELDLCFGDQITFDALRKEYGKKGSKNYSLKQLTNVQVVKKWDKGFIMPEKYQKPLKHDGYERGQIYKFKTAKYPNLTEYGLLWKVTKDQFGNAMLIFLLCLDPNKASHYEPVSSVVLYINDKRYIVSPYFCYHAEESRIYHEVVQTEPEEIIKMIDVCLEDVRK